MRMFVALRRALLIAAAPFAIATAFPAYAAPGELTVLAVPSMQEALAEALAGFRKETGLAVATEIAAPRQLRQKLHGGEHPDLVLADQAAADDLQKDSRTQIARRAAVGRAGLGIAVRREGAVPDLSSPEALKQALLAAKSVLQPDPGEGTLGRDVSALLEQLGVTQEVKGKLQTGSGRNPLAPVGFGDAELGVHSMLDILRTSGVRLAAPVPAPLQRWTRFDLLLVEDAPNGTSARRLMDFLTGPASRDIWQKRGLDSAQP